MKTLIVATLLFLFSYPAMAQEPTQVWSKKIDWGGERDDARALIVDHENSYVTAGIQWSIRNHYSYGVLNSYTQNGDEIWKLVDTASAPWSTGSLVNVPTEPAFLVARSGDGNISKIGLDGTLIWRKVVPVPYTIAANQKNFIALGQTLYFGNFSGDSLNSFPISDFYAYFNISMDDSALYVFGNNFGGSITNIYARVSKYTLDGRLLWSDTTHDDTRRFGTVDSLGNVYVSGTYYASTSAPAYYRTAKYSSDGALRWVRLWDGDFSATYNWDQWVSGVIPYPGGGCIVLGSLTQPNGGANPNHTDFGAIAYDDTGGVRWKMRFQAGNGWERNDLWAGAWDQKGYLVLFGSAEQEADYPQGDPREKRFLFLMKYRVPGVTLGVKELPFGIPERYALSQNYPNPFNPKTLIRFELPFVTDVKLTVYNALGQEVAVLAEGHMNPGFYETDWDANGMPSGMYFYRLQTATFSETKKMLLIR